MSDHGENEKPRRKMRRSATQPRRDLRALAPALETSQHLPLVHVTAVGAARAIIDAGQIEKKLCPVFDTELSYFFVLRPGYRLRDGAVKSDQINRFPSVFVLSPEQLGTPYHVYPFDTGGAANGWFEDRADEWVNLEDYELEPTLEAAQRHVAWAFPDLAAYLEGELRPDLGSGLSHWQDVARSYVSIAGLAGSQTNQPDRRASAVEVAYRDHVPLKGHVKLAVLPKQYLENGDLKNAAVLAKLQAAGVEIATYDWQPNSTPADFQDEIFRIVRRFYEREGVL